MAVAFDAGFEDSRASGSALNSNPFSYTSGSATGLAGSVAANTNRVLIATFMCSDSLANVGTVAVTWDFGGTGQAMTQIMSANNGTNTHCVFLFGLIAPTTGSTVIKVTGTGATTAELWLGAVSLFNCDQATGWQNSGSDTGTGTLTSSTVTTAAGNMAVVAHGNNAATSVALHTGDGSTSIWLDTRRNHNTAMAYNASTGASDLVRWDLGSSVPWIQGKVDVIASSTIITAVIPGGRRMVGLI